MKVRTFNLRIFLSSLILPALAAIFCGILVASGMDMYNLLNKPAYTPPGWLFAVVWTVLYIMMACADYTVKTARSYDISAATQMNYIQLALNFIWVVFFFRFGLLWVSVVVLAFLIAAIILTVINYSKISKKAAYLLIPYLVWCAFALFLNISIAAMN